MILIDLRKLYQIQHNKELYMHKDSYVYLLTNKYKNVLYTGVTSDLVRRIYEHKNKLADGFTSKYNVNYLVYYEVCPDIVTAIDREKQIKGWTRKKKNDLVNTINPKWEDYIKH